MVIVNCNEDDKDFKKLYKKFYKNIFNYIFRNLLNKESAEDITQIVFLNAFRSIKKNNPYIENFKSWIYKIALNEIIKYKDKNKKIKIIDNIDEKDSFINTILDNKESGQDKIINFSVVNSALQKLNPKEKQIIHLYFFENLKFSEISKIMGIKENTLRPTLSRILAKLKKNIGNDKINKYRNICNNLMLLLILY